MISWGLGSCSAIKPVSDRAGDGGSEMEMGEEVAAPRPAAAPAAPKVQRMRTLAVMKVKVGGATKTVTFELFPEDAPMTVESFIRNVKDGLYRGLAFHRAIPNYLAQTGDPLTKSDKDKAEWGTGGPGFTIPAEIKRKHGRGAVAMARLGDAKNPNRESNGSQFYIALGELSALDGKYTVFGNVISGIEVVDEISRVPVDTNDCPVSRVEVKSIRITESARPAVTAAQEEIGDEEGPGPRRGSKPDYEKGPVEKFIERIW